MTPNVLKVDNIKKRFGELEVLHGLSLEAQKGDVISLIGSSGSGKSTFLRCLMNQLDVNVGEIKWSENAEVGYCPQDSTTDFDCDLTIFDWMSQWRTPKHDDLAVRGMLGRLLFTADDTNKQARVCSGGEKNRLMLAKILANPKTCLILDEPTNDLDMDTLDMLEEILLQYKGTLLVVSHDRDFLDQTVTKILAFEGEGKIDSCVGGYSDYLKMKTDSSRTRPPKNKRQKEASPLTKEEKKPLKKLTYKLERELSQLPQKIKKIETDITTLSEKLSPFPVAYSGA